MGRTPYAPYKLREDALHDAAAGEHVADAARHAKVIFKHDIAAIVQDVEDRCR